MFHLNKICAVCACVALFSACASSDSAPEEDVYEDIVTGVNVAGVRYCPPHQRCGDERLPPQPCAQPIPSYYGDVPLEQLADGVELIHPYTRTKIVCFDQVGYTAQECAKHFQYEGYVLVTDLPQLPANYDFLRKGTYPTRRWRDGGETVPRW